VGGADDLQYDAATRARLLRRDDRHCAVFKEMTGSLQLLEKFRPGHIKTASGYLN